MTNAASTPASPTRGVIALIAVLVGAALMVVGFLGGIDAALNGAGGGTAFYTVLFILGAALVLAGIVMAIVHLVRGRNRVLASVTLVIAALPIIAVIALRVAALS